ADVTKPAPAGSTNEPASLANDQITIYDCRTRHRLCTINPVARDNLHPVQPWRFNCELPEVHPVRARSHVFCTRSAEAREHTLETIPNTREFGLTSGLGPSSYRAIPK
ncbi:hypothetical protein, partial [Nonomuraea cavernae]|uniref:hypothetical protein n=1 Tax=Nonomuraea cavernae TaxID=2045107 RepID=UPI003405BAAE